MKILNSALIVTIISGIISYFVAKRHDDVKHVAHNQERRRKRLRKLAYKIEGASYKDTLKYLALLKLEIDIGEEKDLLNKSVHDDPIGKLIADREAKQPSKQQLRLMQEKLVQYITLLLRYNWEQSEKKIKGNISSEIALLLYLATGVVYTISMCLSQKSSGWDIYSLFWMSMIYVIFFCIAVKYLHDIIMKTIYENFVCVKSCRYCFYIIDVICGGALWFGQLILVNNVFTVIGAKEKNKFSILLTGLLYIAAVVAQFVSHTTYVDEKYRYIVEREKIDEDYDNKRLKVVVGDENTHLCVKRKKGKKK